MDKGSMDWYTLAAQEAALKAKHADANAVAMETGVPMHAGGRGTVGGVGAIAPIGVGTRANECE